ncbi:MAG TPA: exodeoxyribonuclease VII large subunit [Thermoanaerobaculia bacterium]
MSSRPFPAAAPPRPYTVTALLAEVSGALRTSWRDVSVVGEIGRFDERSGHGYFTLKDRASSLNAVIFASDLERVPFRPEPGLSVVARGMLDLWAPQGRFQLKVWTLEPVGAGALQLAFEQLKARLSAEGLFDASRKRRIPVLPGRVALVTSPTGAAVRDFLQVLRRRFDGLAVTIFPVRVQGVGAAEEIAAAVESLNRRGGFDVIVLARGGGSPEDLAAFNNERLARAVAASAIPTISAVGHETDTTICDFVADLRAPTPSAAAEIVAERKSDLLRRVTGALDRLRRAEVARLALLRAHWLGLTRAEGLLRFRYHLRALSDRIGQARDAIAGVVARRPAADAARLASMRRRLVDFPRVAELARRRDRSSTLHRALSERAARGLERRRGRLAAASARLEALSPLAVLARGYAVAVREGSARPLKSASEVRAGDAIRVRLSEGQIRARVLPAETGKPPSGRALGGVLPLFEEEE